MDENEIRERIERGGPALSEALTRMASLLKDKGFLDAIVQIHTNSEASRLAKVSSKQFFEQHGIKNANDVHLSVKTSPTSSEIVVQACLDVPSWLFGVSRVCIGYDDRGGWRFWTE